MGRRGLAGAILAGLVFCCALLTWRAGLLTDPENMLWRWRLAAMAGPAPTSAQIRVIALDQQSLDWGSRENGLSWPWPRQAYEVILAYCKRAGAKVVALDLLFSEPSLYGVEDDQALARAVVENGPVVLGYGLSSGSGAAAPAALPPSLPVNGYAQWQEASGQQPAGQPVMPVAELAATKAWLGCLANRPDPDGVFRRAGLLAQTAGQPTPTLALAAWLASLPAAPTMEISPGWLRLGDRAIPIDTEGRSILRFRGPSRAFATYSAAAIIQSELLLREGKPPVVEPEQFKGCYVFFGLTAPGLLDLRATPLDGVYAGVEIHATMLDNLLANDFPQESPVWLTMGLTLLWAVAATAAILACRTGYHSALAFVLLPMPPLGAGFAALAQGQWLPVAVQELAIFLALTAGMLYNFATEGRKKRYLKRAFSQYLHPTVIEQLLRHPDRLRLGGEQRELSIFFSDLQGFTSISEGLDAQRLTQLLNEYLSAMTDLLLESGATIDKYEGDAIIAFWNAPLDQPDHAARAVAATLRCQARLAELRPDFKARFGHELHMRVGINTGLAVVGNLGSSQRFDYSMLGDAVNLAARLEGINKVFATRTLIAEATRAQLPPEFLVREVGRVRVVGRGQAVTVFEPLPLEDGPAPANLARFADGLASFQAGAFAVALESFTAIADRDPVAARYADRCRALLAEPPQEWDGAWNMTGK
ncbi:MAG: CHASE2 domain-containing protein [Thermodesulfobacteriota bacterium]